jgi:hypothetical protein
MKTRDSLFFLPSVFFVILLVGVLANTVLAQGGREDTATILARLGGYPCPDSDFTCVNLTVPLGHFDPTQNQVASRNLAADNGQIDAMRTRQAACGCLGIPWLAAQKNGQCRQ